MNKTEKILNKVASELGFTNLAKMAISMNYSPQALYKWIERDKIQIKKVLLHFPQISRQFIETGEGPVTNPQSSLPVESLTAREPQSFYGTPSDRDILMMRVITDLSEKVYRLGDKIDRMASERKS